MDYKKEIEDLVDLILKEGASDLHLSSGRPPIIRVSGSLIPLVKKPVLSDADMKGFVKAFLGDANQQLLNTAKDVDFSYSLAHARFRGNAYYHQSVLSIALRLIPKAIRTLSELNLPPILESFTRRPQGFFLVVGPIGQGKTTTLATLIEMINQTRTEHILTIEDPIEYLFESKKAIIDQREVRFDTPDFTSALTAMFRQDIDVCMVGEMRDINTIATAVTAAETGHLIFSTLHTNNAAQTINRIIDSFPEASKIRSVFSWQDRFQASFRSVLFRGFPADLFQPMSCSSTTVRFPILFAKNAFTSSTRSSRPVRRKA